MNDQFRDALRRLAGSANEQEAYLRRLGTAPSADELALEFSDAFGVVRDELADDMRTAASSLDRYLDEMSGSEAANLWTLDALHTAPEWTHVRELARHALVRLLEKV